MTEVVLINKTKDQVELGRDSDLQEANANALADLKIKQNSANSPLYIVRVEDPSKETKTRTFAALKLREESALYLEVIGLELEMDAQQNAFKNYNDLITFAEHGEIAIISIRFPWHRVISIENKTYKQKRCRK